MLPLPLRSRLELTGAAPPPELPIASAGTTYTSAQEANWIDRDYFAVGRWDGSLTLFKFTEATLSGPMVAKAVNSPAQEGLQMITALGDGAFVTSNDAASALVWAAGKADWSDLHEAGRLVFDPSLGVANSGAVMTVGESRFLAMGHAEGWLSIWRQTARTAWEHMSAVNVRSPKPTNPFNMFNVRSVAVLVSDQSCAFVLTGSEDGNLTVIRLPDGVIVNAVVYNPEAQRGINSLAFKNGVVLVANCAVGASDHNLWAYQVDPSAWTLQCVGKANLVADPSAQQVFNFDVVFTDGADGDFFCSTEEGLLWMGRCSARDGLTISGNHSLGSHALGAAICVQAGELIAVAYDIHEFLLVDAQAAR